MRCESEVDCNILHTYIKDDRVSYSTSKTATTDQVELCIMVHQFTDSCISFASLQDLLRSLQLKFTCDTRILGICIPSVTPPDECKSRKFSSASSTSEDTATSGVSSAFSSAECASELSVGVSEQVSSSPQVDLEDLLKILKHSSFGKVRIIPTKKENTFLFEAYH